MLGVSPEKGTQKSRAVIDMIWMPFFFFYHRKKSFMVYGTTLCVLCVCLEFFLFVLLINPLETVTAFVTLNGEKTNVHSKCDQKHTRSYKVGIGPEPFQRGPTPPSNKTSSLIILRGLCHISLASLRP